MLYFYPQPALFGRHQFTRQFSPKRWCGNDVSAIILQVDYMYIREQCTRINTYEETRLADEELYSSSSSSSSSSRRRVFV